MTELSFRLKDLENKGKHIDCALAAELVSDALSDMDVDVDHSALHLTAELSKHNVTVLCDGTLTGEIRLPCQRCLRPAQVDVNQRVHTVFVPPSSSLAASDGEASRQEDDEDVDDVDYAHHDGETIDLLPIVREYIILAVPITVYCNEDCRGLCPLCGADRNQGECSCQPVGKLSPFSALRDVKL